MFMSTKQYKTSTMDSQRVQKQNKTNKKKRCKHFCICAFSWRQRHHKSDQPVTAIVKGRDRNQTTPTGVFVQSIDAIASTPAYFGLEYKVKLQKVQPFVFLLR